MPPNILKYAICDTQSTNGKRILSASDWKEILEGKNMFNEIIRKKIVLVFLQAFNMLHFLKYKKMSVFMIFMKESRSVLLVELKKKCQYKLVSR